MFSTTVRTILTALVFAAVSVSATPGLTLKVSGPGTVTDVDNLKISTTLTNTGDETLKILNDPRGPLSKLPTDTFTITNDAGQSPAFSGIKVKYVPQTVLRAPGKTSFTVLAPGQSITVNHDLSKAYNFSGSGAGAYHVEANNLFEYVTGDNTLVPIYADAEAHSASLTGRLVAPRVINNGALSKRATFTGCSASQQSQLLAAAPAAQSYAASSLSYLNSHTASTTRYTTWFGTFTAARHSTVVTQYTNLNSNTYSSYSFDCTCTESDVYAYVYPDDFAHVYLCGVFWQSPTTGTDS